MTTPAAARKCRCGSDRFTAHQIARHDVLVTAGGQYLEDRGIYDSETPYGPFTCDQCGQVYDELEDLDREEQTDEQTIQ